MRVELYVYFQGRCEEALEFYRAALGADATVLARFGDKVGHAEVRIGDTVLLASDGQGDGPPTFSGFSLSLSASDEAEAERLFAALSDGEACRCLLRRRRSHRASAWSPTSSACRGWSCHKMRRGDLPIW
jgi:PhnB protein